MPPPQGLLRQTIHVQQGGRVDGLADALQAWGCPPAASTIILNLKDGRLLTAEARVFAHRQLAGVVRWTIHGGWSNLDVGGPPMPTPSAPDRPGGVRTPAPDLLPCQACGTPLTHPRDGQKACSGRCRAKLHRQAQADARAARDGEIRRLLAAALRVLDGA